MTVNWIDTGILEEDFQRYVREQIYTLPGAESPETAFSILLTGSRAIGTFRPKSDVDIDVLCPEEVYQSVHRAAMEAGLIQSPRGFLLVAPRENWQRYFGTEASRPHFTLTSLAQVEKQFREYEDVPRWIWTHAKVAHDPGDQFRGICARFDGYPRDVLVRKMKYHVLMGWYWDVEVFPHNQFSDSRLLAASAALLNSLTEYLRVFFLAGESRSRIPNSFGRWRKQRGSGVTSLRCSSA